MKTLHLLTIVAALATLGTAHAQWATVGVPCKDGWEKLFTNNETVCMSTAELLTKSSEDPVIGTAEKIDLRTVNCACGQFLAKDGEITEEVCAAGCPGTDNSNGRRLLESEEFPFRLHHGRKLSQIGAACEASLQRGGVPWGLDRINQRNLPIDDIYSYSTTGLGINVYIISTGIRASHQDFLGSDGTSRVRAAYSFDGTSPLQDRLGYGTQVAGIVGGKVYGVAKNATLWSVKVFNTSPSTNLTEVLKAIDWVAANAVKPAVALWLTYGDLDAGKTAGVNALIRQGIPTIVGSGSRGIDACAEGPANVPEAFTCAGSDQADGLNPASNRGRCIDIVAPGVSIPGPSALSDTGVWINTNTNNAPGHVAGAVARLLEDNPLLTPAAVQDRILNASTMATLNATTLRGTPNRLLYTGNFAPPCPAFANSDGNNMVAIPQPNAACNKPVDFPNGTYTANDVYVEFVVQTSNALDYQSLNASDFVLDVPGAQVLSFGPFNQSDIACGGLLIRATVPQDDPYIFNSTQVCLSIPAGNLVDTCAGSFPAYSACFNLPSCPTACMYATNMAYGGALPATEDATALITLAADRPLTGLEAGDFQVQGPATSSISIVAQPDAPTFYFVVVTVPADYYGNVAVAYVGSAVDAFGTALEPPPPVQYTRVQNELLASSVVFEMVPPMSSSMV